MYYNELETLPRDKLRELQDTQLRQIISYVYERVPFYQEQFNKLGIQPGHIRSVEDLPGLPFTRKQDLKDHYPFGMLAVHREQTIRVHASSGTTGRATVVCYTRNDIAIFSEVMARSFIAAGARPGMLLHNAYGYGLFTGGIGFHYGAERLGMTVVPVSGGMTERQVRLIADFKPDVIFVTPSYILAILDEFHAQGVDPRQCSLKIAMCGAEPWTNAMRAEIEDAFDLHAIDNYGLSEIIGPGVSCECIESKDGPHIWEDHFYPEVIDPVTGKAVADGEVGELVFTTLTKEAMPIVRYRTRDLSRLLPGTARSMRRMEKVAGRSDDMMIVRGVNVFPTQIEEQLLRCAGLAPHYQIELRRERRLDVMRLLVEARADHADEASRAAQAAALSAHIRSNIGIGVEIVVGDPGAIERSAGKARRVVDRRPKE